MDHPKHHIFEFDLRTLQEWCANRNMPHYRAAQVFAWIYDRGVIDPAAMTDLSKRDRDTLVNEMTFLSGLELNRQNASDGTRKLLIEWTDPAPAVMQRASHAPAARADENDPAASPGVSLRVLSSADPRPASQPRRTDRQTECVMIPSVNPDGTARRTACISSQVGCPVGCRFCASGLGGFDGNLSTGRIVEQVWRLRRLVADEGDGWENERITNVVFMGMGEPLANFTRVVAAVRRLATLGDGTGISARKITISTVGLPRAIERLADELELPVTLALSLHAPNDALRRELIPWAEYTTIQELLAACRKWFAKTGREITLEYTLLGGVNDREEHADELAHVAKTLRSNINLIRYNEVVGLPFRRPAADDVVRFQRVLRQRGVNAHIRASRGRDIAAACGQLRHENGKARADAP